MRHPRTMTLNWTKTSAGPYRARLPPPSRSKQSSCLGAWRPEALQFTSVSYRRAFPARNIRRFWVPGGIKRCSLRVYPIVGLCPFGTFVAFGCLDASSAAIYECILSSGFPRSKHSSFLVPGGLKRCNLRMYPIVGLWPLETLVVLERLEVSTAAIYESILSSGLPRSKV